jgi:competence protein ComEC
MGLLLLSAALGLLLLPVLPVLPPWWLPAALALLPLLFFLACRRQFFLCLALMLLTFSWSVAMAGRALSARIPAAWEGELLSVQGQVDGLPEAVPHGQRFRLRPASIVLNAPLVDGQALPFASGSWQLFSATKDMPAPGSSCRLQLRLKRPHGVANPGGFDYAAWLLSENVTATGTVKAMQCQPPVHQGADGLRWRLRAVFQRHFAGDAEAGVVLALITGDRVLVTDELWQRYVDTGVVHLMAISGLHITLLAALAGLLVLHVLRRFPRLALYCPLRKPAMACGFAIAALYSLLAGFSVPTERTLIMLAVVLLACWRERHLPPLHILLAALLAVLVWSPQAVHAAGFWLSFGAVAILMLGGHRVSALPGWRQALHLQLAMSLLLLPLTVWFFDRASLVSPLANLLAVPVVTFIVVPLGLAGLLVWLLLGQMPVSAACSEALAGFFWQLAMHVMRVLDALLEQFERWPQAVLGVSLDNMAALLCLCLALFCLLQPVQARWRWLAPVFLLPLWWPSPAVLPGQLRVVVLDVGQGLSVLLQTERHQLLYDTGPVLGESSDAGRRYVLPALQHLGVYRLDMMLLSHADNDHTGGATSVLAAMPVQQGLGALPPAWPENRARTPWQPCRAGQHWSWDGWQFDLLYPDDGEAADADKDNNRSCVLRVSRGRQAALLPGDLEQRGEARLLAGVAAPALRSTVLVLGHHGSRNASSPGWLAAVSPSMALASAGYRNAFHHPSPALQERLRQAGIPWWNTAVSGALIVRMTGEGKPQLQAFRQVSPHYWQDSPRQ